MAKSEGVKRIKAGDRIYPEDSRWLLVFCFLRLPGGRYEFSLLPVAVKQSLRISFSRFRPSTQAVVVFAYFVGTRLYRCFQHLSLSLDNFSNRKATMALFSRRREGEQRRLSLARSRREFSFVPSFLRPTRYKFSNVRTITTRSKYL